MDKNEKKKRIANLHTYSSESYGNLSPVELVKLAKRSGLYALAITDRDTLKGIKELLADGNDYGIELIPGVEMSVSADSDMHILGLFVDPKNEELNRVIENAQDEKQRFINRAIKQLKRLEIEIDAEELKRRKIIAVNDFMDYLNETGVFPTEAETKAFFGKLYFEWKSEMPDPQKCFETIHRAEGIAILAHPLVLGLRDEELKKLLLKLKRNGLDGIEVYHPEHTEEYEATLLKYAKELDLLVSGGSGLLERAIGEQAEERYRKGVAYEEVEAMKKRIAEYMNDMDIIRTFE